MDRRVFFSSLIWCSLLISVCGQQPPSQSPAPKQQQNTPRDEEQDVVRITTTEVFPIVVATVFAIFNEF